MLHMLLDKALWSHLLCSAADLLREKSGELSEIDSRFGDGDHGVTIAKIATLIHSSVDSWDSESIKDFTEALGDGIMGVNGGSAGPLYGTLVGGFAVPLDEQQEIGAPLFKKMLESCRDEMFDISTARVGDKTMMDALIPAVDAALAAPDDIPAILNAAADAAEVGAKASEGFVSKFGRARSYKEQTIGTPDAGAVSTSLFFRGLANGI